VVYTTLDDDLSMELAETLLELWLRMTFLDLWLRMVGKTRGGRRMWPGDIGNQCEYTICGSYGRSPLD